MNENVSPILSVSQLNRQIRFFLETEVGEVYVSGEISNLSKPNSGHLYFTLKDAQAQLRCVFFRQYHLPQSAPLHDGAQIVVTGQLSLYEARGDYQLIVRRLDQAGLGEKYLAYERLKQALQAKGLFDADKKKPLPAFPRCIGLITSATGAALQDMLTTLTRRYPIAEIRIYASEVQGIRAPSQLIRAIALANQEKLADVIILARGGGSIEDLWAFNDEQLVYSISLSHLPIVTGIGHETDFTLADFVADKRAATPTAAAETITPDKQELISLLNSKAKRLTQSISLLIKTQQKNLNFCTQTLSSPKYLINKYWQTLDYLDRRLTRSFQSIITRKRTHLAIGLSRLESKNPVLFLQKSRQTLDSLEHKLKSLLLFKLQRYNALFQNKLSLLHAVSPLATLDRGYAIASFNQIILRRAADVPVGQTIDIRLAEGCLHCEVLEQLEDLEN